MVPLFGMAGLAEAGEALALAIGFGGLLLVGLLTAIGWSLRSRVASGIALALAFVVTLLSTPWEAFVPFQSDDPDVQHWMHAWRVFGCWWVLVMVATLAAWVRAFYFRGKADVPEGEQPAGQGVTAGRTDH
jgi:hypothetical protein